MDANFTAVPILDYSLALSPSTKPLFIEQLRNAAINVGFLYLSNTPVDGNLTEELINFIPKTFGLPQEEKEKIRMRNSPHFLGYSKFGAELTKGKVDMREQFDIATKHECRWKEGDPDYKRLWGPSQVYTYLECCLQQLTLYSGFRSTLEQYLEQVHALADSFVTVLSEAIGLGPDGLSKFYDTPELMQHRSKIVQYPVVNERSPSNQGVGPHYDAGFVTILLQASPHEGLQVQNLRGEWIDAKPIPGTFVFATQGIVRATSHRVLSPPLGSTSPRYSVPFFHNIGLDVLPSQILALRDKRGQIADTDSVNFSEFGTEPYGYVNLVGRVKSHPDVAEQHYHNLFKRYFPEGLPEHGSAY
ncbi:hypothetical protein CPB85DRAFT_1374548 [Mucidula mucida]|nr:hypothetical protein CPB85DRAFT_1374548 [Mucidula mucida]